MKKLLLLITLFSGTSMTMEGVKKSYQIQSLNDEKIIEITEQQFNALKQLSKTIADMVEDIDCQQATTITIPLLNCDQRHINFLMPFLNSFIANQYQINNRLVEEFQFHLGNLSDEKIIEICNLANYLDIKPLFDSCIKRLPTILTQPATLETFANDPENFIKILNIPEICHKSIAKSIWFNIEPDLLKKIRLPFIQSEKYSNTAWKRTYVVGPFGRFSARIHENIILVGKQRIEHKEVLKDIVFSYKGEFLACASINGTVYLYKLDDENGIFTLIQELTDLASANVVAFSYCGRFIVSGSQDGTVCLYKLNEHGIATLIQKLTNHKPSPICFLEFRRHQFFLKSRATNGTAITYGYIKLNTSDLMQVLLIAAMVNQSIDLSKNKYLEEIYYRLPHELQDLAYENKLVHIPWMIDPTKKEFFTVQSSNESLKPSWLRRIMQPIIIGGAYLAIGLAGLLITAEYLGKR